MTNSSKKQQKHEIFEKKFVNAQDRLLISLFSCTYINNSSYLCFKSRKSKPLSHSSFKANRS